eukprot:TRINITY_DN8923_c0_g1_i1.p1 TRINITY_DN8923_c0_g1~~TRINITY_DN8923_c0_g1_i1.p1  ORF type:complete len:237 (-),score=82.50 TRINITY_DN8923_c0_g1_i1:49-759(-)
MLEGIVADLLAKYLGEYVEGLEKDHLKLNIMGGDVLLEGLKLRKSALQDLQLPIEVKEGYLGRVKLQIPWKQISSQPVVISLENIFLIIGPKSLQQFNAEEELKKELKTKKRLLQLAELMEGGDQESGDKKDEGFTARLVTKIVDNLQIYINKVHFRYEDSGTAQKDLFSLGITLESLHAQSTDENWSPMFVSDKPLIYKLVNLQNLALYVDPIQSPLKYSSMEQMNQMMDSMVRD